LSPSRLSLLGIGDRVLVALLRLVEIAGTGHTARGGEDRDNILPSHNSMFIEMMEGCQYSFQFSLKSLM